MAISPTSIADLFVSLFFGIALSFDSRSRCNG